MPPPLKQIASPYDQQQIARYGDVVDDGVDRGGANYGTLARYDSALARRAYDDRSEPLARRSSAARGLPDRAQSTALVRSSNPPLRGDGRLVAQRIAKDDSHLMPQVPSLNPKKELAEVQGQWDQINGKFSRFLEQEQQDEKTRRKFQIAFKHLKDKEAKLLEQINNPRATTSELEVIGSRRALEAAAPPAARPRRASIAVPAEPEPSSLFFDEAKMPSQVVAMAQNPEVRGGYQKHRRTIRTLDSYARSESLSINAKVKTPDGHEITRSSHSSSYVSVSRIGAGGPSSQPNQQLVPAHQLNYDSDSDYPAAVDILDEHFASMDMAMGFDNEPDDIWNQRGGSVGWPMQPPF